jgi:hypothetical protein
MTPTDCFQHETPIVIAREGYASRTRDEDRETCPREGREQAIGQPLRCQFRLAKKRDTFA